MFSYQFYVLKYRIQLSSLLYSFKDLCTWVSPKFHLKNPFESQNEGKKTAANFCQLYLKKSPLWHASTPQNTSLLLVHKYFVRHIQSSRKLIVIITHASPPSFTPSGFFSSNNETILSVILKIAKTTNLFIWFCWTSNHVLSTR